MTPSPNFHFTLGTLKCIALSDGVESVPIESIVKDTPPDEVRRAYAQAGLPLPSPTQATVFFNNLYLETSQRRRILVDAGWGIGTQRRDGALLERLQEDGISPADIDTILLTHCDVDHIGGLLDPENLRIFPNAGLVMVKEAWDFWSDKALVARWPPPLTVFGRQVLPYVRNRIQVVEAGVDFIPGFRFLPTAGHRPGHAALWIRSGRAQLYHLADLVGDVVFFAHPAWPWFADFRPQATEPDKVRLLGEAAASQALVFGSHLPFPGVGRVEAVGEAWRWKAISS
jgi:glyoxylase-like metal-dependent hydrolase (beta-lactamase superfamily II)